MQSSYEIEIVLYYYSYSLKYNSVQLTFLTWFDRDDTDLGATLSGVGAAGVSLSLVGCGLRVGIGGSCCGGTEAGCWDLGVARGDGATDAGDDIPGPSLPIPVTPVILAGALYDGGPPKGVPGMPLNLNIS